MFYFFPGLFCCRSAYGSTVACASPGNNCTRYAHTYSLPPITNCHLTCRRRQRRCTLRKCLSLGAYFQLILCICLNLVRITWYIAHLCSAIWHKCSLNFQYIKFFSFCVFLKFKSYFQTQLNMGHCKRELSKVLIHRKKLCYAGIDHLSSCISFFLDFNINALRVGIISLRFWSLLVEITG